MDIGRGMLRLRRNVLRQVPGGLRRHGPTKIESIQKTGAIHRRLHRFQLSDAAPGRYRSRRPAHPNLHLAEVLASRYEHVRRFEPEDPADLTTPNCSMPSTPQPAASSTSRNVAAPTASRITRICARTPTPSRSTPSRISTTTSKQFERNVDGARRQSSLCRNEPEVADFVLDLAKERDAHADREIEVDDHRGDRFQ